MLLLMSHHRSQVDDQLQSINKSGTDQETTVTKQHEEHKI
jgi:hypothetical protein